MSRKQIVAMPLIMIARLALSPITIGKMNVAPNMATTCWAPRPTVLPQASRWCGATASPGLGSTRSHLHIDIRLHPFGFETGPSSAQTSESHDTPTTATDAEGTPHRLAPVVGAAPAV